MLRGFIRSLPFLTKRSSDISKISRMSKTSKRSEWVRKATMADIPEIISVSKDSGYEEDFLPDYLPEWLDKSNRHFQGYVYIVNDKVVGFSCLFKVDGETLGVNRGGRIRKEYQGKAILRNLGNYIMEQNSYIKHFVFVTNSNVDMVKENIKQGMYRFLSLKKNSFYDGTRGAIKLADSKGLKILSPTDLSILYKEKLKYKHVFKEEQMLIDNVPYRPIESNVSLILIPRTTAIASNLQQPENTLLTFGTHFRLLSGEMMCKIDVYGKVNEYFKNHVSEHIRVFLEMVDTKFIIVVRCNDMPIDIQTAMEALGLKRRISEKYNGETIAASMQYPFPSRSQL